jgi:NAD(P)-dependent dehydrogenase (short-subunit alcohol dehydrogenase family)
MDLENKVAIVTGAGGGIGRAVALLYAANGARVMISDINEANGMSVVAEITAAGGKAAFRHADVADADAHMALVAACVEKFGGLHIACNNAGISGISAPLWETSPEDWRRVIDVNLSGVFYGLRAQIPAMLQSGGGSIINIASVMGQVGMVNVGPYVSSKHGVVGLTRTAALETATQNIRVNAIGPGFIETPMANQLRPPAKEHIANLHPMKRWGRAEEIAELALWLATNKASFATGGYYLLDGGYTAC